MNPSKSYALIIPAKSNETLPLVNLSTNNSQISIVHNVKYLAVNIDIKLKFDSHISSIIQKISRAVGILFKLRYYMPTCALLKIYYTLLFTHNFCKIACLGPHLFLSFKKINVPSKQSSKTYWWRSPTRQRITAFLQIQHTGTQTSRPL